MSVPSGNGPRRPLYGQTFTGDTYDGAVLPYGTVAPSSGYSGSTTSEAAVRAQDADGRTADKQQQTLGLLVDDGVFRGSRRHLPGDGLTWKELDELTGWGHGSCSRVLSDLHKAGRIARLVEERGHCKVYVRAEYVNGREVEAHGGKKSRALAEAEAAIGRVRDLHVPGEWAVDDLALIHICGACRLPHPCPTIRALDGTTNEKRSS